MSSPPLIISDPERIYEEDDEPATRKLQAFRPIYALLSRLTDHAGSGREDGWAMRIDLSDGSRAFVQFSPRKIWQGPSAVYLGKCGGVYAWVTVEGK